MTKVYQRLDLCSAYPYSLREYAARFAWGWVQALLIRYSPRRAHGWRRWWLKRFGAKLRTGATKSSTRVFHPWLLTLGEHSMLSEGVIIYNLGPVTIGTQTVLSQDVYVCAGTHDYHFLDLPLMRSPITIGDGVWVCAGAFIGPGVTIGDNAIIGARAVVMKDVPTGAIVAGNPAKVIKQRPEPKPSRQGVTHHDQTQV